MVSLLEYAYLAGMIYWPEDTMYLGKKFRPIDINNINLAVADWRLISDIPNRPAFTNIFGSSGIAVVFECYAVIASTLAP